MKITCRQINKDKSQIKPTNKIIHLQKVHLLIKSTIPFLQTLSTCMFVSQPRISKEQGLPQVQANEIQSLRMTKVSSNLRTTKVSQNIRNTKLSETSFFPNRPSPKKQKPSFEKIYAQLHNYIDTVDHKIEYLLEKQSSEYKVVYQHYYSRFRDQLFELKQKTIQQEKVFLRNDHVFYIENQLKIFKQQADTYQKLYQKFKEENQTLKTAIYFYKKDNDALEKSLKHQIKQNKLLIAKLNLFSAISKDPKEDISAQKQQIKAIRFNKRSNCSSFQLVQEPQIKITFQKQPKKLNCLRFDPKNSFQSNIVSAVAHQVQSQSNRSLEDVWLKYQKDSPQKIKLSFKTYSKGRDRFNTEIQQRVENNIKVFSICEWFLECVESVKKIIFKRKSSHFQNQCSKISGKYFYLETLEDFLKMDKLEVLKQFLCKREVIQMIYSLLKNEKNMQNNENLHKISRYGKSQSFSHSQKFQNINKSEQIITYKSFHDKGSHLSKKIKFNRTMAYIKPLYKKANHKQLNDKSQGQVGMSTRNQHQKTSKNKVLNIQELKFIQEAKETIAIDGIVCVQSQRPTTISGLLEKRNLKKLSSVIKQKKNIRLSTNLYARRKNIFNQ